MKRALAMAAGIATLGAVQHAGATARIDCNATDNAAWISFLASSSGGLRPMEVDMSAGKRVWSTNDREGTTPMHVSQAFQTDNHVSVDMLDADQVNTLAELRVNTAVEGSADAAAGTLRIVGVGVWPVVCTGM
jgi:hypothetical protein